MCICDPVSDFLTRIRNASRAGLPEVVIPGSLEKTSLSQVLEESGFIAGFRVEGEKKKNLIINLKYDGRKPVIEGLKRISTPSCRIYVNHREIPRVQGGLGVAVLSTSKGLMSDRQARTEKIGGEVLCYVW